MCHFWHNMITPSGIYTFRNQKKPIPPHYYCVFVRGIIIKAPLTGRKKEKCTDHSPKDNVNREKNTSKGRKRRKRTQKDAKGRKNKGKKKDYQPRSPMFRRRGRNRQSILG